MTFAINGSIDLFVRKLPKGDGDRALKEMIKAGVRITDTNEVVSRIVRRIN